jgi:hypothetical protein
MKLTTITHISVDGVMQGLGGQDEDRRGGFERGGWALPLFDGEAETFLGQVYQRADAFLFGRRTYEIFAGYWGAMEGPSSSAIAAALNISATPAREALKALRVEGFLDLVPRRGFQVAQLTGRDIEDLFTVQALVAGELVSRATRNASDEDIQDNLKRAIDDLVEAGIVRKLTRSEIVEFFTGDIERGRSPYQLPCVLEILVPAKDYSERALSEINTCRARLGEEPLTAHNRPPLERRSTPAQVEPAPSSNRATDCSPGDCSGIEANSSVRGTSSTGEQIRQTPQSGIFDIINRIPNSCLSSPEADRNLLALALEKLLHQGLGEADARALFSGMERARRPFPMLILFLAAQTPGFSRGVSRFLGILRTHLR